jgi:hypothetical protein
MPSAINIYCDESCHLQNDRIPIMGFGAIFCPREESKRVSSQLYEIRERHHARGETKWTKVSPARLDFYQEIIEYFFSEASLEFHALIMQNKSELLPGFFDAKKHDSAYYFMYHYLLRSFLHDANECRIYLDVRDSWGSSRVKSLQDFLCSTNGDKEHKIVAHVQSVHSDEVALLQLSDFLLGAVCYANRAHVHNASIAKDSCVKLIEDHIGSRITESTPPWEAKYNTLIVMPTREEKKHE